MHFDLDTDGDTVNSNYYDQHLQNACDLMGATCLVLDNQRIKAELYNIAATHTANVTSVSVELFKVLEGLPHPTFSKHFHHMFAPFS